MAHRDLSSVRSLLPRVLANLARESGNARGLTTLWEEVVGATIASHARPMRLVDGTLVVAVDSARWASELEGRAAELCARLSAVIGAGTVRALVFRLGVGQ